MSRKALEFSVYYFGTVLIDEGGVGNDEAFGLVFLVNGDSTGDGIADIDGGEEAERHLLCQEAKHATDVRNHAARQ